MAPGFSRTIHYEISGAGRIDYQYHDVYDDGARDDPYPMASSNTRAPSPAKPARNSHG